MQTKAALHGVSRTQLDEVVIAYEPIWAIGTGMTATPEDANQTIRAIRNAIRGVYGDVAQDIPHSLRRQYER